MQSFSQSQHIAKKPSQYIPAPPFMPDTAKEIVGGIQEQEFRGEGLASSSPAAASYSFRSSETHLPIPSGPNTWLSGRDLLEDFWKVLSLHVVESTGRLKNLPGSPVINELVSMTTEAIAIKGLSASQKILGGSRPATIADLYALVHITYACAIVIFDGHIGNHIEGLFAHSLAIEAGILSIEDKKIYTTIVWSIWSPPVSKAQLHSSNFRDLSQQLNRLSSDQSWDKGKEKWHQIAVNDPWILPLHIMKASGSLECHSEGENELLNVIAHFLDSMSR
jgi:hypothetical protein